MPHITPKTHLFALLTASLMLSGCLSEDVQLQPEQDVKGRIVLKAAEIEVYTDAEVTRAVQTLTDYTGYTFTLTGTSAITGSPIAPTDISLTTGGVEFEAGTYRLTVTNNGAPQDGNGFPTYWGQSAEFHLGVAETEAITVAMGKPSNAKVTIAVSNSFSTLYEQPRVTITNGTRTITITDAATAASAASGTPAYGLHTEAYFAIPANGLLSYTVTAAARSGSHVTDINATTVTTFTIEAGKAYAIAINADPVTGELIPIASGDHDGEFD